MFPSIRFKNKHILLGITGGIAAYKTAELIRYLVTQEAQVRVIMTRSAEKFISRLTLETLSNHQVGLEMFPENEYSGTHHIHLADWADAAIIAPASYNVIGKLSAGIADDLLTTIFAAVHCPTVLAPAMNVHMWHHPVLQRNLKGLEKLGYLICPPEEGFLAEGYSGKGRLAPLPHLVQYLYRALHPEPKSLAGKKVLITAGRTEEPIDPVRVIANKSSGKMGFAMAWEAFARGAEVTLIHGPVQLHLPVNIETKEASTAAKMLAAVRSTLKACDIYVSAAAIADYAPQAPSTRKIKKDESNLQIILTPTVDILKHAGENRNKNQVLVGFAVETDETEKHARQKLKAKNLDLIVLNNPQERGAAFDADTNLVTIMHKNGSLEKTSLLPKLDIAHQIFQFLLKNH